MSDLGGLAAQLRLAFEGPDLDLLSPLLHANVRWGDGPAPRACRSAANVLATYARLLGHGVQGHVQDLLVLPRGVAAHLTIDWPADTVEDRRREVWQSFRVEDGLIVEIRGHDDLREARAELS